MAIPGASSRVALSRPLIVFALAAAVTAGSIYAVYDRYEGTCMIPYYDWVPFTALSGLFVFGVVCAVTELIRVVSPRWSWPLAIGVAVVTYAAIGVGVWAADPASGIYGEPGADFRLVMSADWGGGLLLEAGAFSEYSCGY